jgi:hypothetical protein
MRVIDSSSYPSQILIFIVGCRLFLRYRDRFLPAGAKRSRPGRPQLLNSGALAQLCRKTECNRTIRVFKSRASAITTGVRTRGKEAEEPDIEAPRIFTLSFCNFASL